MSVFKEKISFNVFIKPKFYIPLDKKIYKETHFCFNKSARPQTV